MRNLLLLGIALMIVAAPHLDADSPKPPFPFIVTAADGTFFFKMLPGPSGAGLGIACRLLQDGSSEELWRTEGWYSFEVFLSREATFLVAMGPWNDGQEPKKEDLAVSFFHQGKLLKRYSTLDLVKDKSKVKASKSHYRWLARDLEEIPGQDPEARPRLCGDGTFRLKTCDGILYVFDLSTGEIRK